MSGLTGSDERAANLPHGAERMEPRYQNDFKCTMMCKFRFLKWPQYLTWTHSVMWSTDGQFYSKSQGPMQD